MLGLVLAALPLASADADPGPTTPAGLADDGTPRESSDPVISGDGSTVVFRSIDVDVDEQAPAGVELYAHDRETMTTEAVDLLSDGTALPPGSVWRHDVSEDGRYVAFEYHAVSCADEECSDIYRRDLLNDTTELVSVSTDGATAANGPSAYPQISGDGQRVVFSSLATDLTGTTPVGPENVFVRDLLTSTTEMANVSSDEEPDDGTALDPAISTDGETVAFHSSGSNLAPGSPSSNDLFLRHLDTDTTEAVLPGGRSYAFSQSQPALDADGGVVAFRTRTDLFGTGEDTDNTRIYTIDLADDTFRTGPMNEFEVASEPMLSDDGRFVAFRADNNPWTSPYPHPSGIYVWDREADTTELETVRSDGTAISPNSPRGSFMSGDGRFVVFDTLESAFPGDVPDTFHVFVHDRAEQTATSSGAGGASTGSPGGPTYADVLEATVSGSPGQVTVTELETEDPDATPLEGYSVLGQHVRVTAEPPAPPAFLTFTFDLDASAAPGYATPSDVDVFRDGAALPACSGPTDGGPCVAERTVLPSGDWRFVAHSPEASIWAIALDDAFEPGPTDGVPPTVTLTRPVDGATYVVGQRVTASFQCADEDSGVASCTGTTADGARIDTSSIGTRTFTVEASDNAGNTATRVVEYRVVWPLLGLLHPVDNPPTLNTARAGATVPVRFTLGGYRGAQVFASGYPQTQAVACPGGARTDEVEQTLPRSAPSLTYRHGVYTYAWRTQKTWASRTTCARLVVRFKDGQQRTALFRLR